MAISNEHKRTQVAGVSGLRLTGREVDIILANSIISEFVGVSVDLKDVWKTTQIEGVSILSDLAIVGTEYYVATRVKDETLGYILLADLQLEPVIVNDDRLLQTEAGVSLYYTTTGVDRVLYTGTRILLENGRSLVVITQPMIL